MIVSTGNREHIFDLILLSDIVDRPICMFSASIKSSERLFVKKNSVAMAIKDFLKDFHSNQIMEDCFSCLLVNCAELKLIVANLIVLGFEGNADFQKFILYFFKNLLNFLWDFPIVMVRKLLTFCSNSPK